MTKYGSLGRTLISYSLKRTHFDSPSSPRGCGNIKVNRGSSGPFFFMDLDDSSTRQSRRWLNREVIKSTVERSVLKNHKSPKGNFVESSGFEVFLGRFSI